MSPVLYRARITLKPEAFQSCWMPQKKLFWLSLILHRVSICLVYIRTIKIGLTKSIKMKCVRNSTTTVANTNDFDNRIFGDIKGYRFVFNHKRLGNGFTIN